MTADPCLLPRARETAFLRAPSIGFVSALDALLVAETAMEAGIRLQGDAVLDPGVGVILLDKVGDTVREGETLAEVHLARDVASYRPLALLSQAFWIGADALAEQPLVLAG